MKLDWDFSELTEFANRLGDVHEFESSIMAATREIAKLLHKALLTNTPILTGNLRKNWSSGENLAFRVVKQNGGYEVTFINEAKTGSEDGFIYASAVNDGHKKVNGGWVMGRFFVERSIVQTAESKELDRIIYNYLQQWWEVL